MSRVRVVLTRDAPDVADGEILAGPWAARATVKGQTYRVQGAVTRWGAKWALRRLIKKHTDRIETEITL